MERHETPLNRKKDKGTQPYSFLHMAIFYTIGVAAGYLVYLLQS